MTLALLGKAAPIYSAVWYLERPKVGDEFIFKSVPYAISISYAAYKVKSVTNVGFNIEHRPVNDPWGAGTNLWTIDKTITTSITTTDSFTNSYIPARRILFGVITARSGLPSALWVYVEGVLA